MAVICKMVRSKRNFLFTLVLKNFYLFNNQELLQSMIISFTLVTLINVRFSGDIIVVSSRLSQVTPFIAIAQLNFIKESTSYIHNTILGISNITFT